jgi:hypothetical protein
MLPFHYRPSNRPPYSLFKKGRQCKPSGEYGLIGLGFNNIRDNVNYQVHTERK